MTKPTPANKLLDTLMKLFALLGSSYANEREVARAKIDELLIKNGKNWNDFTELLISGNAQGWQDDNEPDDQPVEDNTPAPLDVLHDILRRHLQLSAHEFVALTLWVAHTFVFQRFSITPRLIVTSPVRGCGKTTLLSLIDALGCNCSKSDHTTAAVLFREIHQSHPTLLLDEADNQDLFANAALRAAINSGHHCEGKIKRCLAPGIREFSTFSPLALATIGTLPLPLMHRSVIIQMERSRDADLVRFDPRTLPHQRLACETTRGEMRKWAKAAKAKLNLNPPMPDGLRNRAADNWRVLVAIADDTSPEWGRAAREAAIALSSGQDEDERVLLLSDIRRIFDQRRCDRIDSSTIVADLNAMPDASWCEWRGPRGDLSPRPLSQTMLSSMLRPFKIKPRSIWPLKRAPDHKSKKGYYRSQFEAAWVSYCGGKPAQRSDVRHLALKRTGTQDD